MPNTILSMFNLDSELLPKKTSERLGELEQALHDLRGQLNEVVMPEIELRATIRLTTDEQWAWLFDTIKAAPSSAEQLHWLGVLTKLEHDVRRRAISSSLIFSLYRFIRDEQDVKQAALVQNTEYAQGYLDAAAHILQRFYDFLNDYPKLKDRFEELNSEYERSKQNNLA